MNEPVLILLSLLLGLAAGIAGLFAAQSTARARRIAAARETADSILKKAGKDAETLISTAELEGRVRLTAAEAKLEEETQRRVSEVEEQRVDLDRRDRELKSRLVFTEDRFTQVQNREAAVAVIEQETAKRHAEAEVLLSQQRGLLEKIAGYSQQDARKELRKEIEMDARRDASATLLRIHEETRERAAEDARWITAQAIQRVPLSQYAETTVTVVKLPSDEMKGRIIGREGRNIRSLEMSCGIDLIIDDTPEAIIVSSFDPARRMVAKLAIEKLVEDGRIHPARIEDVVAKIKEDFDLTLQERGEAVAFEMGLTDLNPKLVKMAGRLEYLSHHGQSMLEHCREVAHMASNMAALLSVRAEVVRRAALLHKIGFADETGRDRSPLLQSADVAQRLGEPEPVVHCIQALYGMVAPRTIEAVLLQAAEIAAASRPGARKEMLEEFLQRMRKLEEIALAFPGVKEAYAVRAGKELRVIVATEQITDKETIWLSKDIAGRIEKEVSYPGHLRVSVIRETRSVDFAM